jgi:hypothetical protein
LSLTDTEIADVLHVYLITALVKFSNCKTDLSDRDDVTLYQFNQTLSDQEKDILASLMLVEYLRSRVVTSDNYKIALSDADFKMYSQANHIKEVKDLYKEMRSEANKQMNAYSYYNKDLSDLS